MLFLVALVPIPYLLLFLCAALVFVSIALSIIVVVGSHSSAASCRCSSLFDISFFWVVSWGEGACVVCCCSLAASFVCDVLGSPLCDW